MAVYCEWISGMQGNPGTGILVVQNYARNTGLCPGSGDSLNPGLCL